MLRNKMLHLTACKRHNPAAGATQGYDRLHAKRYVQLPGQKTYIGRFKKKERINWNLK